SDQIEACRILVIVNSRHSRESEWLTREVHLALVLKKCVLPIVVDGSLFRKDLELLLGGVHRSALRSDWREADIEKFRRQTHALLTDEFETPGGKSTFEQVVAKHKYRQAGPPKGREACSPPAPPANSAASVAAEPAVLVRTAMEIDETFNRSRSV